MTDNRRKIHSFVRRSGRLSRAQKKALAEYRDIYSLNTVSSPFNCPEVFGNNNPLIIEIGFGMGQATIELAEKFPGYNFLGIEVHTPGVGKVLDQIHKKDLKNLRIIQDDAVEVLEKMVPENTVKGFHVFFPDPWPKKKHHKRRLLQAEFVHNLSLRLLTGGYIYAVTDWEEYAEQILGVVKEEPLLSNPFKGFASPVEWRPKTSFQRKGEEKQHLIREVWAEKVELLQ